jgi:acyl-CoA thioesterase
MQDATFFVSRMLENDHFTRWMGLELTELSEGYCALRFTVKKEMLNGFGTIHGGVLFSAADSAFAFACNTGGILTVALDASISFMSPAREGDVLHVEARKVHRGNKTGFYDVLITRPEGNMVATFRGTAYNTGRGIV